MVAGVRVFAPAKVNLHLGVGARRADGYHDVDTVLQSTNLGDEIEITRASALSLTCEPPLDLPAQDNLAVRAARELSRDLGRTPDVAIRLLKRIPAGAGLGGGSSDAAGVLAGLASLWGLSADDPCLARVAARLGADVAFFLGAGGGTALFSGRGDLLVRALPTVPLDLVLAKPTASIETRRAYAAFDVHPVAPSDPAPLFEALGEGNLERVASAVSNNMEQAACSLVPEVADALAWVKRLPGVLGATVAGSGSAMFAVCTDAAAARDAAAAASGRALWSMATTSRDRGVTVEGIGEAG